MNITTYKNHNFTPYHKQNGIISKLKLLISRSPPMAEEKKESKGSNLIQLKVSDKVKETLQQKADEIGIPITQYIMFLITKDIKKD